MQDRNVINYEYIYLLHRDIKYSTSLFSYKEIRIIKKQEVGNNR